MNLDNPESLIYRPNYKKPEEQQLEKKMKQKQIFRKTILAETQQIANSLLPRLQQILDKPPETRSPTDINFINKYIQTEISPFFTHIAQITNMDVAKNLLKTAHIHDIRKNRLLVSSGQQITTVIIILEGNFGKVANNTISIPQQCTDKQLLQGITEKSPILLRQVKRQWKASQDDPRIQAQFKTTKANLYELEIQKYYNQQEIFNLYALDQYNYSDTLVSCSPGKFMSISYKTFLEALANFVKTQKQKKLSLFRKFQYFNCFDNERMLTFIDQLPLMIKKKGQPIYLEGDHSDSIYILLQGSIRLSKTIQLFKQNPNVLYIDRSNIKDAGVVDYADLSEVYNYKPRNKLTELGIISDICIFGEQEIVCNQNARAINIHVSGQEAHYYQMHIKTIEGMANDKKNFLQELKASLLEKQTIKKILYRQEKLGEVLLLENKNNMDYFYIEGGQEEKPSTARKNKFKINRVNHFISGSGPSSPVKQQTKQKAHYNIFNFPKFSQPKIHHPETHNQDCSLSNLTKQQKKVMKIIHEIGLNKQQVSPQQKPTPKNKRRSYNHSIDIHNPLFSKSYIDGIYRQNARIAKESRMRPISAKKTNNKSIGLRTAR